VNTKVASSVAPARRAKEIDAPVDAILEVSLLGAGLRKLKKALQVYTVVRARLLEKDTGTLIFLRNWPHGWRAFGKKKAKSGDVPLSREEIDGYIQLVSKDIADRILLDELSVQFPNTGYPGLGLRPKYQKRSGASSARSSRRSPSIPSSPGGKSTIAWSWPMNDEAWPIPGTRSNNRSSLGPIAFGLCGRG
jgi:hypothetical protein